MTPRNPWRHRVRDTLIPVLWLWLAMVIFGYALAGSCKADVPDRAEQFAVAHAADVCLALDGTPTTVGLLHVLDGVEATGLSTFDTGRAVALSVYAVCPHHVGLLKAFAAAYSKSGVTA